MRLTTAPALLATAVLALSASGCFGPMYNPGYGYGQGGYPAYSTPGTFQTLAPGQSYVPGGTVPGTGGTTSPMPTFSTPGTGNAPTWGGDGSINRPTPNPSDPYFPNPTDNYLQPRPGAYIPPESDSSLSSVHAPSDAISPPAATSGYAVRPVT